MRISSIVRHWRIRAASILTPAPAIITPGLVMSGPASIRELFGAQAADNYDQFGPVTRCLCGSELFLVIAAFDDDRTIGTYFTDGRCAVCHCDVRLPTEADVTCML